MGRMEPGKPSWSGMTPPSPTSTRCLHPPTCPFCEPHLMYVSLSLSPLILMTPWAGLPQPPGTHTSSLGHFLCPSPGAVPRSPVLTITSTVGTSGWALPCSPLCSRPGLPQHPISQSAELCLCSSLQGRRSAFTSVSSPGPVFPKPLGPNPPCVHLTQQSLHIDQQVLWWLHPVRVVGLQTPGIMVLNFKGKSLLKLN